jgi:kumamolisin
MTAPDPTPIPVRIYTLAEVEKLLDFPSNTGKGQVVGVIGWGMQGKIGIDTASRPNVEIVLIGEQVNGATSGELMMDTAIVRGFLPDATLKAYLSLADGDSIAEAIATATSECNVTTCSFGHPFDGAPWSPEVTQRIDATLQEAGASGVTPCFASGDSGASRVAYPASSPFALAVGGVYVPTDADAAAVWWNWITKHGVPTWMASGGGVNTTYENSVPSYQTAMMPVTDTAGTQRTGRGSPDVAGLAQGLEHWVGTSACSPLWASLIARINCALGYDTTTTPVGVGNIHDVIYNAQIAAGAFTDITTGNNVPPSGQTWGYDAQPGWDACTGWGTPLGGKLLGALQAARPAPRTKAK